MKHDRHPEDREEDLFYNLDDEPQSPDDEKGRDVDTRVPRHNSAIMLWLKLVGTPVEGWKAIKRSSITAAEWSWRCFYPLTLFCALSCLMTMTYDHDVTIASAITQTIVTFMAILLSYICTLLLADILLPQIRQNIKSDFGRIFVMAAISTMSVAFALWNLLPMLSPILAFVPIYTIYLVLRGVKYLRVPQDMTNRTTIMMCLFIIGLPMLLNYIFLDFIPK